MIFERGGRLCLKEILERGDDDCESFVFFFVLQLHLVQRDLVNSGSYKLKEGGGKFSFEESRRRLYVSS